MAELPRAIFVTGASGFVGRHLMTALAAAFPAAALIAPVIRIEDPAAVEAAIQAARPDVCIHLAAVSAVRAAEQAPDHAWQVNFHGTLNLAWALSRHVPDCQLLFVSSSDAYGATFRTGLPLDETAPLAPLNVYAETKAAADFALGGMAGQGLRVVRLRAFNHIGPGQSPDFVVASFARQIARIAAGLQTPVLAVGNIDTWRDFLDVRDVCAAYVACIYRRDSIAPGTILNVASGHARRVGDVLSDLVELAGAKIDIQVDSSRTRSSDIHKATGNATKARETIGWRPGIRWQQTLRAILEDWRERVAVEAG